MTRNRSLDCLAWILPIILAPLSAAGQGLTPPRDSPLPAPAGGTSVSGVVVAAGTTRPVAGAVVTLQGASTAARATSDDSGHFVLENVPKGEFTIEAKKRGYLYSSISRPDAGISSDIEVTGNHQKVVLALHRGGVITGVVLDVNQDPIVGARVSAWRRSYASNGPEVQFARSGDTDDRGVFRLYGLTAGTYLLSARSEMDVTRRQGDGDLAPETTVPVYYPSATALADALAVRILPGEEKSEVTIAFRAVRGIGLSGRVVWEDPESATVTLLEEPGETNRTCRVIQVTRCAADGEFRFTGLPPGRYLVKVEAVNRATKEVAYALRALEVADDPTIVDLQPLPGRRVAGVVGFEDGAGTPEKCQVLLVPLIRGGPVAPRNIVGRPAPNGQFEILGVPPGRYVVRLVGGGTSVSLKAAWLEGRDVSENALTVESVRDVTDLDILAGTRRADVVGSVVDSSGRPRNGVAVVAFGTDQAAWAPLSRRVAVITAASHGTFAFRDLPVGDYYFCAVEGIETGFLRSPEVLEILARRAVRRSLTNDSRHELRLRPLQLSSPEGP